MDIKIVIDKQSEFRMNEAAEKLERYCKTCGIKTYNKEILVVFSNDHKFVKEVAKNVPKNVLVINITENLSEQHIINVIKYVSDICLLKSDVNLIATRIINAYNKANIRIR